MISIPIFLQFAFLAGIISSLTSGIMGSYVVIKRISSITGSISHSILAGIGLFDFLSYKYNIAWLDPMYGAVIASLLSAFLIGWVHLNYKQKEDAVIAMIWSCGMAIGIIFLAFVPHRQATCTHVLFGDLFTTNAIDIYILSALGLLILFFSIIYYRKFLIICFDEETAYLQKVYVKTFYYLLLALISLSIVLLIKIVGIILIIAMLTIPATIANFFTYRLQVMMVLSVIFCLIFNTLGIYISYLLSWPPGATIAIIITIFYIVLLPIKKLFYSYE
ncbi:MAG: metal ABC transporter permease [Parachlamydiales bacterium]|jgi:zinc transport system permease protein